MSSGYLTNYRGAFSTSADLPEASGSPNVYAGLAAGHMAYVLAQSAMYICTDPTQGAAVWELWSGGGGGGITQDGTAYVDLVLGDDNTGAVGDPGRPYQSIDGAMADSPRILVVGEGTHICSSAISFSDPGVCALRARGGRVVIEGSGLSDLLIANGGGDFYIEGDITLDNSTGLGDAFVVANGANVIVSGLSVIGSTSVSCDNWSEYNTRLGASVTISANTAYVNGAMDGSTSRLMEIFTSAVIFSGAFGSLFTTNVGSKYIGRGVQCSFFQDDGAGSLGFHGRVLSTADFYVPVDLAGAILEGSTSISGIGNANCRGTVFGSPPSVATSVVLENAPRIFTDAVSGSYTLPHTTSEVILDVSTATADIALPDPTNFFGSVRFATTTPLGSFPILLNPWGSETIDGAAGTYTISAPTATAVGFVLVSDRTNWYFAATRGF